MRVFEVLGVAGGLVSDSHHFSPTSSSTSCQKPRSPSLLTSSMDSSLVPLHPRTLRTTSCSCSESSTSSNILEFYNINHTVNSVQSTSRSPAPDQSASRLLHQDNLRHQVPQRRWTPADEVDFRRHVAGAAPKLPNFFVNRNCNIGFPLVDILRGRDRDVQMTSQQSQARPRLASGSTQVYLSVTNFVGGNQNLTHAKLLSGQAIRTGSKAGNARWRVTKLMLGIRSP